MVNLHAFFCNLKKKLYLKAISDVKRIIYSYSINIIKHLREACTKHEGVSSTKWPLYVYVVEFKSDWLINS